MKDEAPTTELRWRARPKGPSVQARFARCGALLRPGLLAVGLTVLTAGCGRIGFEVLPLVDPDKSEGRSSADVDATVTDGALSDAAVTVGPDRDAAVTDAAAVDAAFDGQDADGGGQSDATVSSRDAAIECSSGMDSDGDGSDDCVDLCATDPKKVAPGSCGCLVDETDSDGDGAPDCIDGCWLNPDIQGDCQSWRKRLTVQGSQVLSAQSGFPVLVSFASDASLVANADPSGLDIYFADGSGNRLSFERESFSAVTGELIAWVKLDLTGADQGFYIHYGDGDLREKSVSGDVWDGDCEVIYHLQGLDDSTAHSRDGTNRGTNPYASGQIGGARDFDGNAEILGPRGVLPVGDSYWTVSYWGRAQPNNSSGDNEQWAVSTQDFAQSGMTIGIETSPAIYENGNMLSYVSGWRAFAATVIPDTIWSRVDARMYMDTNGYLEFSVNGGPWERRNLNTTASRHTSGSWISVGGEEANTQENWLGQLDEVRISSTLRSDDWLRAEYNNQRVGSTFVLVGAEQGW